MQIGRLDSPSVIDTTVQTIHDKFIDDYTKLLLHLDNGVVDSAKNATVTNTGVTFSTTSKFGGYSALFDAAADKLSVPDSDNWYFGNNAFTIDFWVRFPVVDGNVSCGLRQYVDGSNHWIMYLTNTNIVFYNYVSGAYTVAFRCSWTPVANTWYHVALVRVSDATWAIFVDGASKTLSLDGGSYSGLMSQFAAPVEITGDTNGVSSNYFDEFRISKGIARWTANFTPPTQSYDCPLDTQTKLLVHGGGPNNGVVFYDNSTTARTLTTNGTVIFDSAQYKYRVSSVKFNGTNGEITAIDSDDWSFGTGDFTVDAWVRWNDYTTSSGYQMIASQFQNGSNCWYVGQNGTGNLTMTFIIGGVTKGDYNCSFTPTNGTWYHLAFERVGTGAKIFVNGVSQTLTTATAFGSNDVGNIGGSTVLSIGGFVSYWFNGWMDDVRISKGIARWASDFTPPAAPYDSPLTQYVIDGLDGDVDKEYRLVVFCNHAISGYSALRFNNDSATNYGYQTIVGNSSSASASRGTWSAIFLSQGGYANSQSISDTTIYAKSGKVRTTVTKTAFSIVGTAVDTVQSRGGVWNNTVDNITSMVWTLADSGALNTIGVGSRFILLKKRQLTSGMETGLVDPQGTTNGHWQLIYDNTITVDYGTNLAVGGTALESGHFDVNPASCAFDPFTGTWWYSPIGTVGAQSGVDWIGYDFGSAKEIRKLTFTAHSAAADTITSMKFQYSDNGSSWNDVQTLTTGYNDNSFLITSAGAHRYWRLLANANCSSFWLMGYIRMYAQSGGPKTNLMLTSQMDAYTKLLIHADGADASTAFYDFSNSAHAITTVGTAQVDTAVSKFGGASLLVDGNSDYLTVPDSDDWNFGSGDLTIDCWIMFNSLAAAAQGIVGKFVDDTHKWQLFYGGGFLQFYDYNAGYVFDASQAWTPSTETWYHIAVIRSGNTITLYVNGVSLGSTAFSGPMTNYASTLNVGLSTSAGTLRYFDGWLDEIRISKGIARWTENFTPPTRAYNELDGDRDVMYKVVARYVSGASNALALLTMNSDNLTDHYNTQYLNGQSTTAQAVRGDTQRYSHAWSVINTGEIDLVEYLIYAKSGFVRPCLMNCAGKISGTTVTDINLNGSVWKYATDKITNILIGNAQAGGHGVGTHVELWRLNL